MSARSDLFLIVYPGDLEAELFPSRARDDSQQPALRLRERLIELGYRVEQAVSQPLDRVAFVLFWDGLAARQSLGLKGLFRRVRYGDRGVFRDWAGRMSKAGKAERTALLLLEPPVVFPENWDPGYMSRFPKVLTWNDDLVDGRRFRKYRFPVPELGTALPEPVPFSERRLLVNISANKSSDQPGELYSARQNSIRYFEDAYPGEFDLFGVGWDAVAANVSGPVESGWRPYPSYRGRVESKAEVLGNYRFSLCYENSDGPAGYITEKIFDCLVAGCVPVYWGAPNIADYVDSDAFVDRRAFGDDAELGAFLTTMSAEQHSEMLAAGRRYLASEDFAKFTSPGFVHTVVGELELERFAPAGLTAEKGVE